MSELNREFHMSRIGGFAKLALLAVAFSFLVPIQSASAAEAAVTKLDAVTATVTSTPGISPDTYLVGSSVTVDVNVDFGSTYADDDDTTIKGALSSGSGGTLSATATGSISQAGDSCTLSAPTTNSISVACGVNDGDKLTNSFKVGTYTFVPTTTGSHTLTFWHDFDGDNSVDVGEKSATATFNVVLITYVEVSKESVNTISLATNSLTVSVNDPVSVNWGADTSAFTVAADQKGKFTVKGVLSKPEGAVSTLTASKTASGTDSIPTGANASTETASGITYSAVSVAAGDDLLGNDVLATTNAGFGNFNFTPDVKGIYELTVWHDFDGNGSADVGIETLQKLTITVVSQALANEIDAITATETSSDPYYVGSSITFDVYVNFATGYDDGDDTTIRGALSSGSGGTLSASATGSISQGTAPNDSTCNLSAATVTITVTCGGSDGTDLQDSFKVGTYTFVPTTTGSHTLTFWHDADSSGIDNGAEQKVEVIFEVIEGAPDLTSPTILSAATSEDGLSIRVSTDELLECPAGNCSPDKMNWSISVGGGEAFNPFEVALDSEDLTVIILTLSEAIPSCVPVSLTFDSTGTKFQDSSNNALNSETDFLVSNLVPGDCGGDGDGDGGDDGDGDGGDDGSPDPQVQLLMKLDRALDRETKRITESLNRGARTIMATLGGASAVDEKQLKDAGISTTTVLGTSLALEYVNKNRAKMQSMSDILATIRKSEFMVQVFLLKSNENVSGLDLARLGLVSETYKKKNQLLKQLLLLPVGSIDTLEELEAVISELTKGNK